MKALRSTWSWFTSFCIAETICRLFRPRHELSCPWTVWHRLVAGLRERGRYGKRESGAFLLGRRHGGRTRVVGFILYDDLDPQCLESGIVRFDGRYFGALWDECRRKGVSVVADVHTHPGAAEQSESDRQHPMISRSGHIAIILPRFALPSVDRSEIGIYRYEGGKRWRAVPRQGRRDFLCIGV